MGSIRALSMGKQSWGLEVLGRASARRLKNQERGRPWFILKVELEEWGTRLFVDALHPQLPLHIFTKPSSPPPTWVDHSGFEH